MTEHYFEPDGFDIIEMAHHGGTLRRVRDGKMICVVVGDRVYIETDEPKERPAGGSGGPKEAPALHRQDD